MGATLDALDVQGSRKNGLCQMVCGGVCIFLNIVIFVVMAVQHGWLHGEQRSGAGIWAGVFYIISGSLIFACAKRRNLRIVIPALVMNVISLIMSLPHLGLMSVSIMSWKRERFYYFWDSDVKFGWTYPVYVTLFR